MLKWIMYRYPLTLMMSVNIITAHVDNVTPETHYEVPVCNSDGAELIMKRKSNVRVDKPKTKKRSKSLRLKRFRIRTAKRKDGSNKSPDKLTTLQNYHTLRRKMKLLLFDQECFRSEFNRCKARLMSVMVHKVCLLDQLILNEDSAKRSGALATTDNNNACSSTSESNLSTLNQSNTEFEVVPETSGLDSLFAGQLDTINFASSNWIEADEDNSLLDSRVNVPCGDRDLYDFSKNKTQIKSNLSQTNSTSLKSSVAKAGTGTGIRGAGPFYKSATKSPKIIVSLSSSRDEVTADELRESASVINIRESQKETSRRILSSSKPKQTNKKSTKRKIKIVKLGKTSPESSPRVEPRNKGVVQVVRASSKKVQTARTSGVRTRRTPHLRYPNDPTRYRRCLFEISHGEFCQEIFTKSCKSNYCQRHKSAQGRQKRVDMPKIIPTIDLSSLPDDNEDAEETLEALNVVDLN